MREMREFGRKKIVRTMVLPDYRICGKTAGKYFYAQVVRKGFDRPTQLDREKRGDTYYLPSLWTEKNGDSFYNGSSKFRNDFFSIVPRT